jgi:hypothetical protein
MGYLIYVKENKYKSYALRSQKADILQLQENCLAEMDYLQARSGKMHHRYPANAQNFRDGQTLHILPKNFFFGNRPREWLLQ